LTDTDPARRTIRDIARLGQGLSVRCRRCGTIRAPRLENVAARIGYDTPISADIVFLCSGCGCRETSVTVTSASTGSPGHAYQVQKMDS
jgi:hypothetical protein